MSNIISCICNGMNEECSNCGGKGFIINAKVKIIKTGADPIVVQKQNEELEKYQRGSSEKLYVSNRKGNLKPQKSPKTVTIAGLDETNHLQFVGPNNPNRQKLGDTRYIGQKVKKGVTKKKPGKKSK